MFAAEIAGFRALTAGALCKFAPTCPSVRVLRRPRGMMKRSTTIGRGFALASMLAIVIGCGQTESTAPTAPTFVPTRSEPVPAGTQRTAAPAPAPAPSPTPTPTPGPTPSPAPPSGSAAGRLQVTINPNPVPFSGQPITDVASCRDRPNTWFYDQVLRETGGVAITVTERVDLFDGAQASRTAPNIQIPANGSTTLRTRWCSSSPSAHTAQSNFSGRDANGRT